MPTNQTVDFKMLDVSTAHLSPETRQRLETADIEGVLFYPKGPWGWFIYVPSRDEGLNVGDEVPADLKNCIDFAQTLEKEWIMFDCDGSIVQELPKFESDKVPCCTNHRSLEQLAQAYARHLSVRYGRNVKATVTSTGKISVKDDLENGMYATVSAEFAQVMVMRQLPVIDLPTIESDVPQGASA